VIRGAAWLAGVFLLAGDAGEAWADVPMVCRANLVQYQRHNTIRALRCDQKYGMYNACKEFEFDPKSLDWALMEDARYVSEERYINQGRSDVRVTMVIDPVERTFLREAKIRWPEGNTARTVWKGKCTPRVQEGDVTVNERGPVETPQ
jgi:hypothetical protein